METVVAKYNDIEVIPYYWYRLWRREHVACLSFGVQVSNPYITVCTKTKFIFKADIIFSSDLSILCS